MVLDLLQASVEGWSLRNRLPDALLDRTLGSSELMSALCHMLLNGRDLALDVEVIVPHAEVKSAVVLASPLWYLLKLLPIQGVQRVDLKNGFNARLTTLDTYLLDDTGANIILTACLTDCNTDYHMLPDVSLVGPWNPQLQLRVDLEALLENEGHVFIGDTLCSKTLTFSLHKKQLRQLCCVVRFRSELEGHREFLLADILTGTALCYRQRQMCLASHEICG